HIEQLRAPNEYLHAVVNLKHTRLRLCDCTTNNVHVALSTEADTVLRELPVPDDTVLHQGSLFNWVLNSQNITVDSLDGIERTVRVVNPVRPLPWSRRLVKGFWNQEGGGHEVTNTELARIVH